MFDLKLIVKLMEFMKIVLINSISILMFRDSLNKIVRAFALNVRFANWNCIKSNCSNGFFIIIYWNATNSKCSFANCRANRIEYHLRKYCQSIEWSFCIRTHFHIHFFIWAIIQIEHSKVIGHLYRQYFIDTLPIKWRIVVVVGVVGAYHPLKD